MAMTVSIAGAKGLPTGARWRAWPVMVAGDLGRGEWFGYGAPRIAALPRSRMGRLQDLVQPLQLEDLSC